MTSIFKLIKGGGHSRIDAVFANATDFEIMTAAQTAIEELYGFETILERDPRVPYDRWVAHTVAANSGFFDGEGYSYFWGTNCDHHGYAESLRVIGLPILATIIEESITMVPADILGDWDAVDEFFGGEDERIVAAETMDAKLISEDPDIDEKVSKYIRQHRYSYSDLVDAIEKSVKQWRVTISEYER